MDPKQPLYFLEVVKEGESPSWSVESPDLVSISRALDDGYIQFWAHPKDSVIQGGNEPPCEHLARQYQTDNPALIVNQLSNGPALLELLVIHKGHVWVRTESSLDNLNDNVAAILDYAKNKFNIKIEGFMTTDSVSPEVEEKMDQIEGDEQEAANPEEDPEEKEEETVPPAHSLDALADDSDKEEKEEEQRPIRAFGTSTGYTPPVYTTGNRPVSSGSSSKLWLLLPVVVLAAAIGGGYYFKDSILHRLNGEPEPSPSALASVAPEPTLSPTPSPLPSIDRSKYTIRVLNGTTTSGAASALGDKLKELGWKIERVGNATDSAVAQTRVRIKSGLTDVALNLIKDLAPDLSAASNSAVLPASDRSDAEVTIGKE